MVMDDYIFSVIKSWRQKKKKNGNMDSNLPGLKRR